MAGPGAVAQQQMAASPRPAQPVTNAPATATSAPAGNGFFQNVGNWLGNVFGVNQAQTREKGAEQATAGAQGAGTSATQNQAGANQAFSGAQGSLGANAGQTLGMAQNAATPLAQQQAEMAARGAGANTLSAARTAGLNKGQAALMGGQTAGQTYQQTLTPAIQQQIQNYLNATGQFTGLGGTLGGLAQQGFSTQAGTGANLAQSQGEQAQEGGGILGNALSGAASGLMGVLSDERLKTKIRPARALDEVLKVIRPIKFEYKAEPGAEHMGVTAQDVEKTPLASSVKDTPAGKMIDTAQMTPQLLDLIIELGHRVKSLEGRS